MNPRLSNRCHDCSVQSPSVMQGSGLRVVAFRSRIARGYFEMQAVGTLHAEAWLDIAQDRKFSGLISHDTPSPRHWLVKTL